MLLQLVGAQLWPAFHHALFTHAVCAEHGEFVHVAAHDDHADGAPGKTAAISQVGAEDDAHDHCQLPPGTRDLAAPTSERAAIVAAGSEPVAAALVESDEPCLSIPILALAPKQSPPS